MVHASPNSNQEYVYESDEKQDIIRMLSTNNIDALLMGHTHLSYIQKSNDILLVNCGSVGRSREKDRRASYAILTISSDGVQAEIIKIDYPISKVASEIFNSEIPNFYGEFLLE